MKASGEGNQIGLNVGVVSCHRFGDVVVALVEEKNTLESREDLIWLGICFVFCIWFFSWVFKAWKNKKVRFRFLKQKETKLNWVLRAWFIYDRNQVHFWLEFDAYVDQVSTLAAAQWENRVSYTRFITPKSSPLVLSC